MSKGAAREIVTHETHMQVAIDQARKGAGFVESNPMVGAVLVHKNKVLAKSYHARFGGPHAEARLLTKARKKFSPQILRHATLYITLEPCTTTGKTPACMPQVVDAGIKRVVIGSKDPNPKERGKSVRAMRKAGVEVTTGVLSAECDYLIRAYAKWITTGLPFVLGKVGMSLDGKITPPHNHRYITNTASLRRVHDLRQEFDSILVGVNTVIRDNPQLNTRLPISKLSHPTKVILDSRLRTPTKSALLNGDTIIACFKGSSLSRKRALARRGADIIELPPYTTGSKQLFDTMNLERLLEELGQRGITSLLIEGGSYVFTTFINRRIIDEFHIFIAPHLYGATRLPFTYALQNTVEFEDIKVEQLDDNILVRGYAKYN